MKNLKRWSVLTLYLALFTPLSVHAEWTKAGMPDGGAVFSLAATGTDLFAATDNGVFRTSDYGANWSATSLNGKSVHSVAAKDGRLFAATTTGVMVSTDLGVTWATKVSGEASCVAVSDGRVWTAARILAAPYISVYYSTDNGDHWTSIGSSGNIVNAIAARGNMVFIGTGNGVFTSEQLELGYSTWYNILSQAHVNALVAADTSMYVATWYSGYGMYVSQDFGSFQSPANIGLTNRELHTVFIDGSTLYAGTQAGAFRSSNGGANWTAIGLDHVDLYDFARIGSDLFAGSSGGVSVSTDSGATWTLVNTGLKGSGVYSLIPQGDDLLLSSSSGIFRSSDAGGSWTNVGLANNYVLTLLLDNSTMYAGTGNGVARSSDNGATWTEGLTNGMKEQDRAIEEFAVTPSGTLIAGTHNNGAYRSTDNGANWVTMSNGLGTPFYSLLTKETCVLAGTYNGIFRSTDEGFSWTRVSGDFFSVPASNYHVGTMAVRGDNIYAAGYYGIFVSSDDGQTWVRFNIGLTTLFVRDLMVHGADLYASTSGGVFVLGQGASAWIPINGDGLLDNDIYDMAVVGSDFLAIAQGGYFYPYYEPDPGREIWKRPLSQVACCTGTYGNVDQAGTVDLSDLSLLVSYLTGGGNILPCPIAANVSGNGIVDLADMSAMISFLTGGGYVLPNCP